MTLIWLLVLAGCGRYGSPVPPDDIRPDQVRNFRIDGSTSGLQLNWTSPASRVSGGSLDDLDGFSISKAVVTNSERGSFEIIAKVRYQTDKGVSGLGEALLFRDQDVVPGATYDYFVAAYTTGRLKGLPSNILRVTFKGSSSEVEALN